MPNVNNKTDAVYFFFALSRSRFSALTCKSILANRNARSRVGSSSSSPGRICSLWSA